MEVIHVRMDKIIDQRVRQYANTFGIENWLIDKRLIINQGNSRTAFGESCLI